MELRWVRRRGFASNAGRRGRAIACIAPVRVGESAVHRHRCGVHPQFRVHAGDHDVQLRQQVITLVEGTVLENVHLDPGQDAKRCQLLVELGDQVELRGEPFGGQPAGGTPGRGRSARWPARARTLSAAMPVPGPRVLSYPNQRYARAMRRDLPQTRAMRRDVRETKDHAASRGHVQPGPVRRRGTVRQLRGREARPSSDQENVHRPGWRPVPHARLRALKPGRLAPRDVTATG